MIVVEDGKKYLGEIIECTVTSVLQTSAGKMIFAKNLMRRIISIIQLNDF